MISPIDALDIINYLNLHGAGALPQNFSGNAYLDVNGDDNVTPVDALAVIDYLDLHSTTPAVTSAFASVSTGTANGNACGDAPEPIATQPMAPELIAHGSGRRFRRCCHPLGSFGDIGRSFARRLGHVDHRRQPDGRRSANGNSCRIAFGCDTGQWEQGIESSCGGFIFCRGWSTQDGFNRAGWRADIILSNPLDRLLFPKAR